MALRRCEVALVPAHHSVRTAEADLLAHSGGSPDEVGAGHSPGERLPIAIEGMGAMCDPADRWAA